jgi:riboflavin kinase / FMN adenylyltransferase
MQHVTTLEEVVSIPRSYVAIGGFDGVHLGHRALIAGLVTRARNSGGQAVVLTFYPHPSVVLRGPQKSFYLTTPAEKAEYLAELGVDVLVTHRFDSQLVNMSAAEFVDRLVRFANMAELWCGPDFALGHKRQGNVEYLREAGTEYGFSVRVIEPVIMDGAAVSSTRIRQVLHDGAVEQAAVLLGRPYQLAGDVVQGAQRGRKLGIPTANLAVWEERLVPAVGVYACHAHYAGGRAQAVINIGFRPTFDGAQAQPVVEAHLLDFAGDLYHSEIRLDFIARLRSEMKFPGVDALLAQIRSDIVRARELLAPAGT